MNVFWFSASFKCFWCTPLLFLFYKLALAQYEFRIFWWFKVILRIIWRKLIFSAVCLRFSTSRSWVCEKAENSTWQNDGQPGQLCGVGRSAPGSAETFTLLLWLKQALVVCHCERVGGNYSPAGGEHVPLQRWSKHIHTHSHTCTYTQPHTVPMPTFHNW